MCDGARRILSTRILADAAFMWAAGEWWLTSLRAIIGPWGSAATTAGFWLSVFTHSEVSRSLPERVVVYLPTSWDREYLAPS